MHPALQEINDVYLQVEPYIRPKLETLSSLTEAEAIEWMKNRKKSVLLYKTAIGKFVTIADSLSPNELISAYQEGSSILRANITGYVCRYFDRVYVPMMLQAIREDHEAGFMFLRALHRNQAAGIQSVALNALASAFPRTREAALGIVYDDNILEAIPKVVEMTQDSDPEIAAFAKKCLQRLTAP